MSYYIKIDNTWVSSTGLYKKENGAWVGLTQAQVADYLCSHSAFWGGYVGEGHSFLIGGAAVVEAVSAQYVALFDNLPITASWSILSGGTYATVDSTGSVTILPAASASAVVLSAAYQGFVATRSLVLTYKSGSTSETTTETTVDPDTGEVEVTTTTTTTNDDGSSTSETTTIVYDDEGNVQGSTETNTTNNSDGSYTESTVNYDENGDPTDGTNVSGDTEGNVDTQTVEYDESGSAVVTGYSIDTSNNPSGSKDITGTGVDTEFIPFSSDNNDGFVCHIRFRTVKSEQPNPPLVVDTEDNGSNYLFNILTAKSAFKPWRGFHIRWALAKKNYNSGNLVLGYTSANASSTTSRTLYGVNDVYDFTISYDPQLRVYPSKFRCVDNQGTTALVTANIDFAANDMDFVLGYAINQQDQPYRYSNVTIYEFSVTRLPDSP